MLKEFVQEIKAIAEKSQTPFISSVPGAPDHQKLLVEPGKGVTFINVDPPPRCHKAGSLASIISLAKPPNFEWKNCVVWYDRTQVTLLYDDGTRRDKAVFSPRYHPQFQLLKELEEKKTAFKQADFLKLLRVQLRGLADFTELIALISKVRFGRSEESVSEITQGKASIGRHLQAEMANAAGMPTECRLEVVVCSNVDFLWEIDCHIEIDPAAESFRLYPFPGEIEEAIQNMESFIGAELAADAGCPIYFGQP